MTTYVEYQIILERDELKIVRSRNNPNSTAYRADIERSCWVSERPLEILENINILIKLLQDDVDSWESEETWEFDISLTTRIPFVKELLEDFASKNAHDMLRIYIRSTE